MGLCVELPSLFGSPLGSLFLKFGFLFGRLVHIVVELIQDILCRGFGECRDDEDAKQADDERRQ